MVTMYVFITVGGGDFKTYFPILVNSCLNQSLKYPKVENIYHNLRKNRF